jgi:predicted SAM-dependent methyltransferase
MKKLNEKKIGDTLLYPFKVLWRKYYWWQKERINPRENKRFIDAAIASNESVNLELGSPSRPEMHGWIASDINGYGDIKMDFTKPLPFPSNSVDRIYSSHILEHFSYPNPMIPFLKECVRILKVGGEFSISVPDASIFLEGYRNPDKFDKEAYCSWEVGLKYESPIDYVNFIAYLGGEHKHWFDKSNLCNMLREAGWSDVSERNFDDTIDLEVRKHESVYAKGIK